MEYALSTAIKKLSVADKPSVALIQGHGEPPVSELSQVYSELGILYNVQPLTLADTTIIPEKYKTIAIIRPKDTIPPTQLLILDNYLATGGHILLAINRVEGNFTNAMGTSVSVGMEDW